jgi:hypothetical protein
MPGGTLPMTLWDEKPNYWSETDHRFYPAIEMDPFLEKIKPYVELAEQIIDTFNEPLPHDEVIAGFKAREHLRKTYEMITELAEKAEKWEIVKDYIIVEMKTDPPSFFGKPETLEDLVEFKKKLEAIKSKLIEIRDDEIWSEWQHRNMAVELLGLLGVEE